MKKIIVKEIDKLVSTSFKNKSINEYIIYINVGGVNTQCFIELGEENKTKRILELKEKEKINTIILNKINLTDDLFIKNTF